LNIFKESHVNFTDFYILIAEDEITHSIAIRRMLERHCPGARIEVVSSIQEYRNKIAAGMPSIVLLDLNLTDGCTLDMLKESTAPPVFPVVMLSSYASSQVAAEAMEAGALDFIIKSPEVFLSIAEIVNKSMNKWNLRLESGGVA
jgi:DNA-binding NtrC family response regulator